MSRAQQLEQQIQQLNAELKLEYNKELEFDPTAYKSAVRAPGGTIGAACQQLTQPRDPIDDVFTFHDNPDAVQHYVEIREAAKTFARVIDRHAPYSEDKRYALASVRQAVMWANAAIELNGRGL